MDLFSNHFFFISFFFMNFHLAAGHAAKMFRAIFGCSVLPYAVKHLNG